MNKIMKILGYLYVVNAVAVVLTHPESPLFTKNRSSSVKKGKEINGAKLIFCDSKDQNCQAIDKFYVSENNTFDCYQSGVEIEFNIDNLDIIGILQEGLNHILKATNDMAAYCKKIRRLFIILSYFNFKKIINIIVILLRFYVNQFKELIQIDDSIFLVDKINSDSLIFNTLYQKGYTWRWIAFYLSMYDEKKDGIILKKTFEVKISYFIFYNFFIITFF
jgi:hypothetical protein